jgi:rare lipoprotein A
MGERGVRNRCWNIAVTVVLVHAFGCGFGTRPAFAEATLLDFFTSRENSKPAIGTWKTTVTLAKAAAGRDADWSASVMARAPSNVTTGSVPKSKPLPGPRLTGKGHALNGNASYYFEDQMTATGEHFDRRAMTAAHKTLPFGTRVRVTRADTGNSVIVRINDRGPYKEGRIIDLSERAAEGLGMTSAGVAAVRLEVLGQ